MNQILLIGGGGHCKVVIDAILSRNYYNIKGIIDTENKLGQKILDIPVIDHDANLKKYYENGIQNAFISVGSIGNNKLRLIIFDTINKFGFFFQKFYINFLAFHIFQK